MLHQYDYLCVASEDQGQSQQVPDVKEAWSFAHPAPQAMLEQGRLRASGSVDAGGFVGGNGSNEHNARECKLTFAVQNPGVCHGLAAYFETVLYAGSTSKTELSTNPVNMEEKSKDMISWFPIFFPLKVRLLSIVSVGWRDTDDSRIPCMFPTALRCRSVCGARPTIAVYGTSGSSRYLSRKIYVAGGKDWGCPTCIRVARMHA